MRFFSLLAACVPSSINASTTQRCQDGSFFQKPSPYVVPGVLDLTQPSLWIAVGSICFNPLYWNIVAQNEYHNKTITKILGGRRYLGCYLLAVSIFSLGILRDHLYILALKDSLRTHCCNRHGSSPRLLCCLHPATSLCSRPCGLSASQARIWATTLAS